MWGADGAVDRPFDDEARAGQQAERRDAAGDSARRGGDAVEAGDPEPRSRSEYYDVLWAADQRRSGWDEVDARDRPAAGRIRHSPDRAGHILDGDPGGPGGGHRHGTGRPGKTEFPASWDDQKILDTVLDVARRPDSAPILQEFNGRWRARGTREEVEIVVVVASDGDIWTSWPLPGGAGVVRNPRRERS